MWQSKFLKQAVLAALIGGMAAGTAHAADKPEKVRLLMDWFGQANHSGYFQAQIEKLGMSDGIEVEVLPGGPKIQTIPQVAAGQAEFGKGNADDILLARGKGVPVTAVFVALDHVPYTFVYHPKSDVKSIEDLSGNTVAVSLGAAYWTWIKQEYELKDVKEIPVTGDLSLFRENMNMVQQGYSIFLPARMTEAGIDNAEIKVVDLGYRPYDVLFTTEEMIAKNPEVVKATVAAAKAGWASFIKDPSASKEVILKLNPQISPPIHDASIKLMKEEFLPEDPKAIGCMVPERWTELSDQLKEADLLPADFDPSKAFDASFVEGC